MIGFYSPVLSELPDIYIIILHFNFNGSKVLRVFNKIDDFQGLELSVRIAKKTGESGSNFASTFSNVSKRERERGIKDCYHESNQLLAVTHYSADKDKGVLQYNEC